MSRMIDADALKDNMFGYAPPEMTWDRSDIEHKIDEMPTIHAIPVEWLKACGKRGSLMWIIADILIERWQKEQEAR